MTLNQAAIRAVIANISCKCLSNPAVRWVKGVVMSFLNNNCSMHAAGLTYFSLLAVIPTMCILLFGAKQFGVRPH